MQVRILSGNETGAVKDLPQTEAENAIATGYAELYDPAKDQAALDAKNASEKKFGRAPRAKRKKAAKKKAQLPRLGTSRAAKATGKKKGSSRKK